MRKLKKKIKVWLACLTRADEVWVVYKTEWITSTELEKTPMTTIFLVTYRMEDAVEYLNTYNKRNKVSAWMTKQIVL